MADLLELVDSRQIASGVHAIVLRRDEPLSEPVAPGTFLDVLCGTAATSLVLRRPLSIADASDDGREMTLILRVVGTGTAVLAGLPVGSRVDCLGPLGQPFRIESGVGRALLVGGGVGVPPLYLLGRRLVEAGVRVQFRLGFRDAADVFWTDRFADLGQVLVSTDDGSAGTRGTVADLEQDDAARDFAPEAVYACGPLPMLRYVQSRFAGEVPTQLSLEERMACGVGACYACVVQDARDADHQYRICWDGPVFDAQEVAL
ncbi:dihydroorotate dehydrogenase electron transfer subunit [Acidipropionibacterium timonense]|uniref:dihydroorotate dehydrogenase electron transfer subunit n=1 Tax=Acidipropionibacterium timonense TaxID=2161818 RepID=UPI00102FB086|nr:dihydroorotate dehydrogenase electron transfer subunit [Acidipropionibacterium timonense]